MELLQLLQPVLFSCFWISSLYILRWQIWLGVKVSTHVAAESVTDSDAELEHPQGLVEALWSCIPTWSLYQPGWHGSVECCFPPAQASMSYRAMDCVLNQVVTLISEIGTCCRLFVAAVLCGMEEGQIWWFTVKTACSFPVCSCQISTVRLWNSDHVSALGGIIL